MLSVPTFNNLRRTPGPLSASGDERSWYPRKTIVSCERSLPAACISLPDNWWMWSPVRVTSVDSVCANSSREGSSPSTRELAWRDEGVAQCEGCSVGERCSVKVKEDLLGSVVVDLPERDKIICPPPSTHLPLHRHE